MWPFQREQAARLPTDVEILETIFSRYYQTYADFSAGTGSGTVQRQSKVYVPIDVAAVANDLKAEPDLVFGRLYYHLQRRYGYTDDRGAKVPFFALDLPDPHCVHFPYMTSVLAALRDETQKHQLAIGMAAASLGLSLVAILVSVFIR